MNVEVMTVPARFVASHRADRLVYIFMATLFILVAAVGFGPRLFATLEGARPVEAPLVHVHAFLMGFWLLLLLAQTSLVATDRRQLHQTLGQVSFVLAPLMLILMVALTVTPYYVFFAGGPPAATLDPVVVGRRVAFTLFVQGRDALLFAILYSWAVRARRASLETHKRMMVMATFVVLDAAVGRMDWLPHGYSGVGGDTSYAVVNVYQLLLLVPVIVYDVLRFGRVHRAYVFGVGLFLLFIVVLFAVWNSALWHRTAAAVMGLDD
jgi:hypothetical protein